VFLGDAVVLDIGNEFVVLLFLNLKTAYSFMVGEIN